MAANRLITYFVGEDVSMSATMNEINGSLTNTSRRLSEMGRVGSQNISGLGREFDRFKRHFGYATAGLATYEIFNAVSRLKDYQTQLAQVNAVLGDTPGQLQQFGQAAIDISTRTAQPLNDVLQSMQNIAQSIPNMSDAVQRHLIPAMAQIEAMGARVSGTDPRSFGSTVLGLATAFYGRTAVGGAHGTDILSSIANKLVTTQFTTPRVTGQDIATYIPMLAGGALTSGFTLDQMLSLFTVGQRIIQRPATTAQYLRQLMIRLHAPTRAEQPFFAQAGLGPDQLKELNRTGGGMTILRTLLMHALSLPGNNLNGMTPAQFLQHPSFNKTTLSPDAAQFIQNTIGGRIQSLVAARAITAGLGQIPIAERTLRNAPTLEQRFGDMNLSMQKASTALGNMTTDIGTTFLPAIDTGSKVLVTVASLVDRAAGGLNRARSLIDQHTGGIPVIGHRLGGIAEIGAIAAGAVGIRSLGKSGLARNVLARFGLRAGAQPGGIAGAALGAERGLLETQAAASALSDQAHGTPSSPFWVVIHPLSMSQIPLLAGKNLPNTNNGGVGNLENKAIRDYLGLKTVKSVGSKIIRTFGRRGIAERLSASELLGATEGGAGGVLAGAATGGLAVGAYEFFRPGNVNDSPYSVRKGMIHVDTGGGFFKNIPVNSFTGQFLQTVGKNGIPRGLQSYFARYGQGQISQGHFDQIIANYVNKNMPRSGQSLNHVQTALLGMFRMGPGHQLRLSHVDRSHANQGYVEATLNLEPTAEFKGLLRPQSVRVHIPVSDLPAPTSRARTRVPRRG